MKIKNVKVQDVDNVYYLHPGPRDSVYYTDYTRNVVGCITLEGDYQFRHTSKFFKRPQAVITDKKGNLYILCKDSNNIQRLNPKGEFLGVILNNENEIWNPYGMVFSNDCRKLFVSSRSSVLYFLCA